MSNYIWHEVIKECPSKLLIDHYYYLVTHSKYGTPMKAKWHDEMGGIWEVFIGNGEPNEHIYSWDDPYPILAWMQMPANYEYSTAKGY